MSELPTEPSESTVSSRATALLLPLVLVADADGDSRDRRGRQLERRGFRVSLAKTAFEAIVKASCHVPDAIVLDDSLADIGVEDLLHLLSTCPATAHIPILRVKSGRPLPRTIRAAARA